MLAQRELAKGRDRAGTRRMLEREVKSPLRLREPAPAAIGERGVPFVPDTAGLVTELRPARELKGNSVIATFETDGEHRVRVNQVSDFTKVLELAVAPGHYRAAVRAHRHDGRADLEDD